MRYEGSPFQRGFSLIEVTLVLAILSVLVAMALPNYLLIQMKAKRTEGYLLLQTIKIAETGYYLDHDTYTRKLNNLNQYATLPNVDQTLFYETRSVLTNSPKVGYFCMVQGQLDGDPPWDVLVLKVGNPGFGLNKPQGISIEQDDMFL